MEVCAGFELIAIENATALGHDVLELSKRPEAQMIRHMRHGSPPRLIALQSILSPNRRESLPTPSAGVCITLMLSVNIVELEEIGAAAARGEQPAVSAAVRTKGFSMAFLRDCLGSMLKLS